MNRLAILAALGALTVLARASGTVTFDLSSPNDGGIVAPGALVSWTITVSVSTGDNFGLALATADLVQDVANPALFDLPAGQTPLDMADFDRPDGISNPGPGGVGSAYGGTPVGTAGAKNLVQIGGAQNTFGVPGNGIGLDYFVRTAVGQSAPQMLATGSFSAPSMLGLYSFYLENPIASTLDEIRVPPDFSPISAAVADIGSGSFSFTVQGPSICRGDTNCDDLISYADINPFVKALSNLSGWQVQHPGCPWQNCDINGDDVVSYADINPFVILMQDPGPCP